MRLRTRWTLASFLLTLVVVAGCKGKSETNTDRSTAGSPRTGAAAEAARGATAPPSRQSAAASDDANTTLAEPLRRSLAVYRGLKSYADTGTVIEESPGITSTSRFNTYFRRINAPDFYFDYSLLY